MPNNVHDALFKSTFSEIEHARGALQSILPAPLAARIDWATLTLRPGSFVEETLNDQYTDLLFSAQLSGHPALLYLLYEHQSSADPRMPLRLLRYLVNIWEGWGKDHPHEKRVPAILPVVLHHSKRGWTAARSLEELFDLDPDTLAIAGDYLPRLRLLIDDLTVESDEALQARAMTALGRLVLYCLRHGHEAKKLEQGLGGWLGLIDEVRTAPNGVAALFKIWRYILLVDGRRPAAVMAQLGPFIGEKGKEELVTAGEYLLEKGRREGRKEEARRLLLKLLVARFGALPAVSTAKIQAASLAKLET